MFGRGSKLLLDPSAFFKHSEGDRAVQAFAVVMITILLQVGGMGYLFFRLISVSELASSAWTIFGLVAALAVFVLFGLMRWVAVTWLASFLSTYWGGSGNFRDLLVSFGWCHTPNIFSNLITFGMIVLYSNKFTIQSVQDLSKVDLPPKYSYALNLVTIAITLWTGFLWVFAIKNNYGLDHRRSMLVSGIITGLLIAWTLRGFVI